MENLNKIGADIADNVGNFKDNIVNNVADNVNEFKENIQKKVEMPLRQIESRNFFTYSKEFMESNTVIAKATFLLLVIIVFVFLFYIFSKLLMYFMTPTETPYLINGMKDATQSIVIPQTLSDKGSIPIYRSQDEYDGIEFTYSFWMYATDVDIEEDFGYRHIFHKGSLNNTGDSDIYGPNTCPGVYLYKGRKNISDNLLDKYPLLGLLVRVNVFHDNNDKENAYKYFDDVYIDGIPIKKWVGVVIRVTSQNIIDVYINGTLTKRHKLSNIIKQNYDNVYINMKGGFPGNLSNLKYYNYAIGTFEIEKLTSAGPSLKMAENSNIHNSKPEYLSPQWYFNETDTVM